MREGNYHRPLVIGWLVTVHWATYGTVSMIMGLPGDCGERLLDSCEPVCPST